MAAKKTADWVPLCHSGIGIEGVKILVDLVGGKETDSEYACSKSANMVNKLERHDMAGTKTAEAEAKNSGGSNQKAKLRDKDQPIGVFGGVRIETRVQCHGKTGVEMEALTAVLGAALTVVDMCKGVDRGCRIESVRVVKKEGGRSGVWREDGYIE